MRQWTKRGILVSSIFKTDFALMAHHADILVSLSGIRLAPGVHQECRREEF